MKSEPKIVTPEDVDAVWGNASFGPQSRMGTVKYGLLKCAGGWYQGHTSRCILTELGLIDKKYRLTLKGKRNLFAFFKNEAFNV